MTIDAAAVEADATRRRWGPLLVLLSGSFMTILDFFIVNVAVPTLQVDLDASPSDVQLVVAGYGLTYAAGLVVGGRIGDLYGRRRMFTVGLVGFVVASAACGVAPTIDALIVARIVQGAAAAVMAPQVLTLLGVAFAGAAREWAFSAYGVTLGLASGAGQILGGALIDLDAFGLGWRSCFLINVPVGLVALVRVRSHVVESFGDGSRRLDVAGAVLTTVAMAAVVLPLIEGRRQGWPPWTWMCWALAGVFVVVFVRRERRLVSLGRSPLVHPGLFARRQFSVGIVAIIVFYSGVASFFLILSLYLQQGRGLGAFESGVVFSVMVAGFLVTTFAARPIKDRVGDWALPAGALLIGVAHLGLYLAVRAVGSTGDVVIMLAPLVAAGAGLGIVMGPVIGRVLATANPAHAGAASGVLASSQQLGNAVGVAAIGIVYYSIAGTRSTARSVVDAAAASHAVLAAFSLVVVTMLIAVIRTPDSNSLPGR